MPKKIRYKSPYLAYNLRFIRNIAGITQRELSERINVERTTIPHYEKGDSEPSFYLLGKIIDYYNTIGFDVDYNMLLSSKLTQDALMKVFRSEKSK